jgi:hypothetical protein
MIETIIYNRQDLTIQECNGKITDVELLETAQSFFGRPHTVYIVWDFSFAHLSDFSPQTIEKIVAIWLQQIPCSECKKIAIVAPENLEHSFSSMFKAILELCKAPLNTNVFGSLEEAKQWLFSKEQDQQQ